MVKKLFKTIVIYTINTLNENSIFSTRVEKNQIFTSNNGWGFEESMKIILINNLPFVTVALTYHGKTIQIDSVLIDTGSATTILSADDVASIDIRIFGWMR